LEFIAVHVERLQLGEQFVDLLVLALDLQGQLLACGKTMRHN
jgi:hypothetical protein